MTAKTAQTSTLRLATGTPRENTSGGFFHRFMAGIESKDRETYTLSKTTVWLVPIIIALLGVAFTIFANYGAFVRADETKQGDIRLLVEKVQTLKQSVDAFQQDWKSEAKETKIELKTDIQKLQIDINQITQRTNALEAKINGLERREGGSQN